jgi:hypothetical protein
MSRRNERLHQQAIDRFVRRLLEPEGGEIDFGVPSPQELKIAIKGPEEICRRREADPACPLLNPLDRRFASWRRRSRRSSKRRWHRQV